MQTFEIGQKVKANIFGFILPFDFEVIAFDEEKEIYTIKENETGKQLRCFEADLIAD